MAVTLEKMRAEFPAVKGKLSCRLLASHPDLAPLRSTPLSYEALASLSQSAFGFKVEIALGSPIFVAREGLREALTDLYVASIYSFTKSIPDLNSSILSEVYLEVQGDLPRINTHLLRSRNRVFGRLLEAAASIAYENPVGMPPGAAPDLSFRDAQGRELGGFSLLGRQICATKLLTDVEPLPLHHLHHRLIFNGLDYSLSPESFIIYPTPGDARGAWVERGSGPMYVFCIVTDLNALDADIGAGRPPSTAATTALIEATFRHEVIGTKTTMSGSENAKKVLIEPIVHVSSSS
ncbi:hypothetical protein HY988_02085 [Candidatus Micrarchaeota archaeon]|nr:hypothetical protein [Candidatus Micrarchaeota archaeon]